MNIQEIIQKKIQWDSSSDALVYSVIYNNIVEIVKREKWLDISDAIISVSMNGDFLRLKLKKAILKEEISHISWMIETEISQKLGAMWKTTKKVILILR